MENYELIDVEYSDYNAQYFDERFNFRFYCYDFGVVEYRGIFLSAFGTCDSVTWHFYDGEELDFYINSANYDKYAFDATISTSAGVFPAYIWELLAEELIK